jgi:hypothetical protein
MSLLVIYANSCHLSQFMSFMSIHVKSCQFMSNHVNSCQKMSFMLIHVISCQFMPFMSFVIRLFRKFSKLGEGGEGSNMSSKAFGDSKKGSKDTILYHFTPFFLYFWPENKYQEFSKNHHPFAPLKYLPP